MRRYWIIVVIVAQVVLLAVMAGQREWILRTGRTILMRSAPVDPEDPMRGEYVRLRYDFSRVPKELCRDGLTGWFQKGMEDDWRQRRRLRDRQVFAVIRLDRDNMAEFIELTDRRPTGGIFLRGRVDSVDDAEVQVRYGVEAVFTQQGGAKAFEAKARGEMAGVPVDAEVALGSNGIAVVRGYHWEPLGITVAVQRGPAEGVPGQRQRRPMIGLTVELKNHGAAPVAIVDRPGARSFRLLREIRWGSGDFRWVHDGDPVPPPKPGNVVVLQPGESRKTAIDLTSPDWFVLKTEDKKGPGVPASLAKLDDASNVWFRFEYVPPTAGECAGLPHAELIQPRSLRTRVFSPAMDWTD
jgi:uncharacterized membrane-anchored protein